MEFGHLKSKIETKLVESYKTNTFNKEIKTFRKLVLENELINMAYHLYEELSKEKGFSKDFADDFLSECVDIYQRLNITEKLLSKLIDWTKDVTSENQYKDIDSVMNKNTFVIENIVYFDIECEIAGALTPELIKNAPTKITSIAVYDNTTQKYYCLILDEKQQLETINEENRAIIPFAHEHDLLHSFLNLWEQLDPTVITGWNTEFFDVPFLYYRIENQLGADQASRLSPLRKVKFGQYAHDAPVELAGLNHLDYMLLFKKYIVKQEPSYKLGDIGEKYVKLGKVEYDGNLDKLFQDDINKFIEYNLRDVEIIIELEKKLKFIDLTIAICHLCHVPYEQIYLSTVLNDGAILTYLKRQDIVSPNKPTTINPLLKESTSDEYAGGYLKDPVPGLYEWVIDLDFTSLYPSIIRSLNIGIETLIGRIVNNDKYDNQWTYAELVDMDPNTLVTIEKLRADFTLARTQVPVGKIVKMIEDNKWVTAASGAIFRTDKSSVVCEVLTDWFNKRKHYKKLMSQAYKSGDSNLGDHYHRLQHAYKIKLNDVYGCYAINGWRYTDGHKIISSAITLTGQRVTQESIKFVVNVTWPVVVGIKLNSLYPLTSEFTL